MKDHRIGFWLEIGGLGIGSGDWWIGGLVLEIGGLVD